MILADKLVFLTQEIVERSLTPILVWSREGDIIFSNHSACEVLEINKNAPGKCWDISGFIEQDSFPNLISSSESQLHRVVFTGKSGHLKIWEMQIERTVIDTDILFIGYLRDVSTGATKEAQTLQLWLETMFEGSPLAITIRDMKGNLIRGNEAWHKLWAGLPIKNNISDANPFAEPMQEIYTPEQWDKILNTKKTGEAVIFPEIRMPDWFSPNIRWISQYIYAIKDSKDQTSYFITMTVDITRKKETELSLQKNEERWKYALEGNGDGVWDINNETKEYYYSDRYKQILGYGTEDEFPSPLDGMSIVHPDDLIRVKQTVEDQWRKDTPGYSCEYRALCKNGEYKWILDRGLVIKHSPEGKELRVVGTHTDISERKELELRLCQSEALYRTVFENTGTATFLIDENTFNILLSNSGSERLLGLPRNKMDNQINFIDLIHPDDLDRVEHFREEYLTRGESIQVQKEFRLRHVSGEYHYCIGVVMMIPDTKHSIISVLDITDRKRTEAEKAKLESQLRQAQKMEAIGTLAGGIAHDFNNILTSVYGFIELTMLAIPKSSNNYDNLSHVLNGLDRASDLINQILAFSRKTEQEFKVIDIIPMVKETLKLLRASLPSTITIEANIPIENGYVMGDLTQIQQVLINLCTNAHYAMRETGGVLTVSVDSETVDQHLANYLGLTSTGDFLRIVVKDTGKGMDVHTLERIFDPFFTTKPVGEGTGLGLSIVHGIISAHKGAVNVYSELGVGTTFLLYFPVINTAIAEISTKNIGLPHGFGRILLVDDEDEIIQMTVKMLELLGYVTEAVNSSLEALSRFQENPERYDLLITDLTMPKMSGIELSRLIHEIRPNLPIALTTGFSADLNPDQLKHDGILVLIMKPYNINTLGNTINQLMRREET